MDPIEAARLLGVADTEVVDVRAHAGWWDALHHDQASHEETWREVPGNPETPADDPAEPVAYVVGESGPELVDIPAGASVAQAVPDDDPDGPGVDTDGDGVPEGSARQILAWVDGDRDRAAQALAAEQGREAPRSTLVAALEKLVG